MPTDAIDGTLPNRHGKRKQKFSACIRAGTAQYLLYKHGEEQTSQEVLSLESWQYEKLRNGYGDWRVKPLDARSQETGD